jgi:hypothetical protein
LAFFTWDFKIYFPVRPISIDAASEKKKFLFGKLLSLPRGASKILEGPFEQKNSHYLAVRQKKADCYLRRFGFSKYERRHST